MQPTPRVYDIRLRAGLAPPPVLGAEALWVILAGILGIAGLRTYEKKQGVAR